MTLYVRMKQLQQTCGEGFRGQRRDQRISEKNCCAWGAWFLKVETSCGPGSSCPGCDLHKPPWHRGRCGAEVMLWNEPCQGNLLKTHHPLLFSHGGKLVWGRWREVGHGEESAVLSADRLSLVSVWCSWGLLWLFSEVFYNLIVSHRRGESSWLRSLGGVGMSVSLQCSPAQCPLWARGADARCSGHWGRDVCDSVWSVPLNQPGALGSADTSLYLYVQSDVGCGIERRQQWDEEHCFVLNTYAVLLFVSSSWQASSFQTHQVGCQDRVMAIWMWLGHLMT